jgi:LmbE family N-acetylglucosaminyl deacetylase
METDVNDEQGPGQPWMDRRMGIQPPGFGGASCPISLLGVWAHPDDETYLSAVLMARVAAAGGRVVVATATRGERGGTAPDRGELAVLRERELRSAMSYVGVHDVRILGYADGACSGMDPSRATHSIIEVIDDVRPDVIVTFGPDGMTGHPDHVAVSRWTTAAATAVGHGRLLYATMTDDFVRQHEALHDSIGVWMGGEPRPVAASDLALHVVPTPRERALKRRALRAHASQTAPLIELIGPDAFDAWWVDEYFREATVAERSATAKPGVESWLVS